MPTIKRISSRAKGKNGELELAEFMRQHGYPGAFRGQQFHGGAESPDVVVPGLEGIHVECKRVESGSLYNWLEQAINDAGSEKVPVVMHRKSRKGWVAIMRLEDLLNILLVSGI